MIHQARTRRLNVAMAAAFRPRCGWRCTTWPTTVAIASSVTTTPPATNLVAAIV